MTFLNSGSLKKIPHILFLLGFFICSAATAQQYRVVYLTTSYQLSKEDSAAIRWLKSNINFSSEVVPLDRIRNVKHVHVVWFHLPDSLTYEAAKKSREFGYLRSLYESGTNFLFTNYAAFLPYDLGVEPSKPSVRVDTIQNYWLFDKRGFQGFRGHPLFSDLFGGEFVWDPDFDQVLRSVGYFGSDFPESGKVIAVEKSYIVVRGERKLVIEHSSEKARSVSVGSSIYFAPHNNSRANLNKFIENALLYLAGKQFDEPLTYWQKFSNTPRVFRIHSPSISKSSNRTLSSLPHSGLLLTRKDPQNDFFDVAGRRALIMGKENGGIDEIWVHPFRVLRDYQAGIVTGDSVVWLQNFPVRIEVRPESFRRIYSIRDGELRETIFSSLWRGGGVVHYEFEGDVPIQLVIRFRTDLRWMWPFDANALGDVHYAFDDGMQALHVKDTTGSFYCLFGGDVPPLSSLSGRYQSIDWTVQGLSGTPTEANQVSHAGVYQLGKENDGILNFAIVGTNEGKEKAEMDFRALLGVLEIEYRQVVEHYSRLLSSKVQIDSPDKEFNDLFQWAIVATDRFFAYTPSVGKGLLAGMGTTARGWDGGQRISGRPGYAWYFGRDSQWSSFAINDYGDFDIVKQQLEFLQQYQDLSGKIFHEISTSGVVHFDAADATPLYLILAAHYLRASGDIEFIKISWPHLIKAMNFLYSTDTDDDGLIENTNVGHGWVEGGALFGVHTEFYLAALWAQALSDMAFLSSHVGESDLNAQLEKDADRVRVILNEDFWSDSTRFFHHGKYRNGTYNSEKTVFPAVGAYFNLLDDEKVKFILEAYAGNGFTSDWGVRILSSASQLFDPRGYHYGSVWPLFTGWAALAEYEYGNSNQGFMHIWNNLFIKNHWALGFVEEVMNGAVYKPAGVCAHQCWSETGILHPAITGMIGWKPNAVTNIATLKPRLPLNWDTVTVRNLRMGESVIRYSMKRGIDRTEYSFHLLSGPEVQVHFQPELPEGMEVRKAVLSGNEIVVDSGRHRGLLGTPITFTLDGTKEMIIEHTKGIGMVPVMPRPQPGDSSAGWRIISTRLIDKEYTIELEGTSGEVGSFTLHMFDNAIADISNAEVAPSTKPGVINLRVTFDQSTLRFSRKTVTIVLQ
jgi:GH15 family glucan-1,4-alpha-glucosidase